jgi:hypothetical protein
VRSYFSSIIVFTSSTLSAGNLTALRDSGVIKHQNLTVMNPSCGRSLVVIKLDGDKEEETWRRQYSSAASIMGHGEQDHSHRPVREDNVFWNKSGYEAEVLASGSLLVLLQDDCIQEHKSQ